MNFMGRFVRRGNPEAEGSLETENVTIESASNFDELYAAIRSQESIVNDRGKEKDPEHIIDIIEELRKKALGESIDGPMKEPYLTGYGIDSVTRAEGIRDKVLELLAAGRERE